MTGPEVTVFDLVRYAGSSVALGVEAGAGICYEVEQDGRVVVTRVEEDADSVVGAFLDFLERDMIAHPENIQPLSEAWMARMKDLVGHIKVDLDDRR